MLSDVYRQYAIKERNREYVDKGRAKRLEA